MSGAGQSSAFLSSDGVQDGHHGEPAIDQELNNRRAQTQLGVTTSMAPTLDGYQCKLAIASRPQDSVGRQKRPWTALPQSLVGRHAAISLETAEGFEMLFIA